MKIDRNQLLTVLSEALDSIEKEVLGVTDYHAKRVAWLCIQMGKKAGMSEAELSDLAISALFHDNALNEFKQDYANGKLLEGATGQKHCIVGEENLKLISKEREQLRGFILYHHENADGSGAFGKTTEEVPLGAQLIHIADIVDLEFALGKAKKGDEKEISLYIQSEKGRMFSEQAVELFSEVLSVQIFEILSDTCIQTLQLDFTTVWIEADRGIAELFARIIDYKSPFTKNHSIGVAQKAEYLAKCYGYDELHTEKLYMAGALHDIGKLLVDVEVLEKAGRLNEEEYQHIQNHAYETYRLLSKISGFEEIRDWASYHHEKLNGKGYPFGVMEQEMSQEVRILACIDIYQALTEDRPYKVGMHHTKAISILEELVQKGELDGNIVECIKREFNDGNDIQKVEKTALFQCSICGYIYEGDAVPYSYVCPVCGQLQHGFYRIE
ncbi:MAG: HD domain-containing protein [Lachnospiraceae bacterium]|nr:HD domain-containing protein [Lachnospiraceae bacterium]